MEVRRTILVTVSENAIKATDTGAGGVIVTNGSLSARLVLRNADEVVSAINVLNTYLKAKEDVTS